MDSFNPFANAWGDDTTASNAASTSGTSPNINAGGGFKFPSPPSTTHNDDPLGFGASARSHSNVLTPPVDDAWSAPVASTSAANFSNDDDEWSTSAAYAAGGASAAVAAQDTEDHTAWKPAASSPVLDPEPPAWAVEDDELRDTAYTRHHASDDELRRNDDSARDTSATETADSNDGGGFGGFSEASLDTLPNLSIPRPSSRSSTSALDHQNDNDRDWGATELPPSRWEEDLSAPPTWRPSSPEPDASKHIEIDESGDPWRPAEPKSQTAGITSHHRRSGSSENPSRSSRTSFDPKVISPTAELDLERLQSELGVQIRNLDEEYAHARPSTSNNNSPTPNNTTSPNLANSGSAAKSKWSIWGGARKSTADEGSRRNSSEGRDAGSSSTVSPRASTSSSVTTAPAVTKMNTPDLAKDQPHTDGQAAGPSRFWGRFGKGRVNSSDPSASTTASNSTSATGQLSPSLQSPSISAPPKKSVEITDDFSQLENFDSKRSTSANGMHTPSGYDDFGIGGGSSKDDDEPNKKGWFWNRRPVSPGTHRALQANSRVVDYSTEQEEEQDLDKVFSAFTAPPPSSSHTSHLPGQGVDPAMAATNLSSFARRPSLKAPNRTGSAGAPQRSLSTNRKNDPFAHLSAAASSIRSSASIDPFDPLDPLAELNQASNITSRHYKDRPSSASPSVGFMSARSPPALAPPPSSSSSSTTTTTTTFTSHLRPSPSRSVVNTPTPPPLMAPPPPLSSISRSKVTTPQPSLLDDLADLQIGSANIASPASGPGSPTQAPVPVRPHDISKSSNLLDDEFGDFETSPVVSAPTSSGFSNIAPPPHKATGPMKLPHKGARPGSMQADLSLLDLL